MAQQEYGYLLICFCARGGYQVTGSSTCSDGSPKKTTRAIGDATETPAKDRGTRKVPAINS
ncbi:unnamed protein product [Arabidopsis lyrata]|nr:unnamed protein product [Arabidopsis lyrata]